MIFSKRIRKVAFGALRWLLLFYLSSLLVAGSAFRIYVNKTLPLHAAPEMRVFLGGLDEFLVRFFWFSLVAGVFFSLLFVRRFFMPLASLMERAKAIRRGDFDEPMSSPIQESRGEWYQLDLDLSKIAKDLRQRRADVARERSELEAVITAANDAILAIDRDLTIRYYNAPMANLFDQKDEGHWGKKLHEVVRTRAVLEAFELALEQKRPQFVQVSQELAMDAAAHYFQVSVSPFFDEKRLATMGAVAIFHDITEHKRLEKVRVDFVANASHEIKTPLTSIQGYLEHIKERCADRHDLREAFRVVESNVDRLNSLVSDLLELSKVDSLEVVQKEEISIREFCGEIVQQLQPQILSKQQILEVEYGCETVKTSRPLLTHVLVNLLENASKYSQNGAQIRIRWRQDRGMTQLSVKDNGPGIESYHQKRIFERFYRVREGKGQTVHGTGLGLSIVRNATQRMGGHLDLKSAPGLGSEFICSIPNED